MPSSKVVEYIDIDAPRDEVFELILNLKRRMQLSPLWGFASFEKMDPEYPEIGSSYQVKPKQEDQIGYTTIITDYQPLQKLAYRLTADTETSVTWTVQPVAQGTRIIYEEEFLIAADQDKDEFTQSVKKVVSQWLKNIKNYSELREGRIKKAIRWFLDRFFLNLRNDQRSVIITILFMQIVAMISFVMAAIALGVARTF